MANYAYIDLPGPTTLDALEGHVQKALKNWFRGRLAVSRATREDGGPTLFVYVPKFDTDDAQIAETRMLERGEIPGFSLALWNNKRRIASRHAGVNMFVRWTQGVMEELLAESYGQPIFYDATDLWVNPGARRYRAGPKRTFYEYLCRSLGEPYGSLSETQDQAILRYKAQTPEAFWK